MKRATTIVDKIIIFCKDIERTSAIYCETLGLKIVLQSPQFVELKDANNLRIFLNASKKPYHLPKGYSPILSFNVQYFDEIRQKLLRCQLIQDGQIIQTKLGKLVNFQGPEGEHISINNFQQQLEENAASLQKEQQQKSTQQIKNILSKIKL